jgi:hypothetical protein
MSEMILFVKTVDADGRAYGGFQWPLQVGAVVVAPDWNDQPSCGGGLHGLPWGEGDGTLLNWGKTARWIVFEADVNECVLFEGKGKCQSAIIRCVGTRAEAVAYLHQHGKPGAAIVGGAATAGDHGAATAGDYGAASAGAYGSASVGDHGSATAWDHGAATARACGSATAGDHGAATAGDHGAASARACGSATAGDHGSATSGHRGSATAGAYGSAIVKWCGSATAGYRGAATAGNYGAASAGAHGSASVGDHGAATAGAYGSASAGAYGCASAGVYGSASAGAYGIIVLQYCEPEGCVRVAVGHIGDGLLPNVPYRLDEETHQFVQATPKEHP